MSLKSYFTLFFLVYTVPSYSETANNLDEKKVCENIMSQSKYGPEVIKQILAKPSQEFIQIDSGNLISVSDVLSKALELGQGSLLISSASELRFLPYTQEQSEIIIISSDDSPLTETRAEAVIATANRSKIKVHTIWTGPKNSDKQNWLEFISNKTSGHFLSFTNLNSPCTIVEQPAT